VQLVRCHISTTVWFRHNRFDDATTRVLCHLSIQSRGFGDVIPKSQRFPAVRARSRLQDRHLASREALNQQSANGNRTHFNHRVQPSARFTAEARSRRESSIGRSGPPNVQYPADSGRDGFQSLTIVGCRHIRMTWSPADRPRRCGVRRGFMFFSRCGCGAYAGRGGRLRIEKSRAGGGNSDVRIFAASQSGSVCCSCGSGIGGLVGSVERLRGGSQAMVIPRSVKLGTWGGCAVTG
jgi:hypothetical protein